MDVRRLRRVRLGVEVKIEISNAAALVAALDDYADMLTRTVKAGASVGFVQPFTTEDARLYWLQRIVPAVDAGASILFEARVDDRIAGTVQLVLPSMPNQVHKGDVSKMMVHPDFRRRGIARAMLEQLFAEARIRKLSLLTLDTRTGDAAQRLYAQCGFEVAGEIPGFAIDPDNPAKLDGTTYMYKWLD